LRELEKELRLSLLALGAVTGTAEPSSPPCMLDDGISNGNGVGGTETKRTAIVNSESSSRTASAGGDGSAVENGQGCRAADEDNSDNVEADGEDLKNAVDVDSVAGTLREVRLDGRW
jgi:hypothetical protein